MANNSQEYSEELLLNPKPGTAAAAARDYGIDLTLTVQNLRLSPEDRVRRLDRFIQDVKVLRSSRIVTHANDK
jgi:hypothetical protein